MSLSGLAVAEPVDDGYSLSGAWSYVSGSADIGTHLVGLAFAAGEVHVDQGEG
jgi:hypothetical protein